MGEGRRGEPEASPLSSPGEAGEVVGVDLAPVATRSRGTGRGGSDRWGFGGLAGPPRPREGKGALSLSHLFFYICFLLLCFLLFSEIKIVL